MTNSTAPTPQVRIDYYHPETGQSFTTYFDNADVAEALSDFLNTNPDPELVIAGAYRTDRYRIFTFPEAADMIFSDPEEGITEPELPWHEYTDRGELAIRYLMAQFDESIFQRMATITAVVTQHSMASAIESGEPAAVEEVDYTILRDVQLFFDYLANGHNAAVWKTDRMTAITEGMESLNAERESLNPEND